MDLNELVERGNAALGAGKPREALRFFEQVESARPDDPTWPRRQADIYRRLGDLDGELAALVRTSRCLVDSGEVVQAIATCKEILEIDAAHTETLDRIHLLYMAPENEQPPPRPAAPVVRRDGEGRSTALDPKAEKRSPEAPLGELLLTESLLGAHEVQLGSEDLGGISEIPLDTTDEFLPDPDLDLDLDLHLSTLDVTDPFRRSAPDEEDSWGSAEDLAGDSTQIDLLKGALFGSLDPSEVRDLLLEIEMVDVPGGSAVFHQGDRADRLYVVVDGAVVPIAESESRVRMAVLEPGDFFGEIGLLSDQPRNATCEALVDTRLLAIDRPLVWNLLRRHPEILRILLRTLRERLVDRLTRTSPLFAAFAAARRSAVSRQFRMLEVRPDRRVLGQGLSDQGLFVVLSGNLDVVQRSVDGKKTIAELGHGDVFGEMSILFDTPANAGVVSRSKCWLLFLSYDRFRTIARANPGLVEFIREVAQARYQENWERTTSESRAQAAIEAFEGKPR